MRALHRFGRSRTSLPLRRATGRRDDCSAAVSGAFEAAPVAGPSRSPSQRREWSSSAFGVGSRQGQTELDWVRRRYSTATTLTVDPLTIEEGDDKEAPSISTSRATTFSAREDDDNFPPPPATMTTHVRLRDQFRNVFRRPRDHDSFEAEPEQPRRGLLPSYTSVSYSQQALLLRLSGLLHNSDARAHRFRIGDYSAPFGDIWQALLLVHQENLTQHLHPSAFPLLIRLVGPHSWEVVDKMPRDEARAAGRLAHQRIFFILDRMAERSASAIHPPMEGTALNTRRLQEARLAALEHYADWGYFAGAEMVWDVFARDGVRPETRAFRLLFTCAARDAQLRNWAPQIGFRPWVRVNRPQAKADEESDGAGGPRFVKKVIKFFADFLEFEAARGHSNVSEFVLEVRSVVECLAAEKDYDQMKTFLRGVSLDIDEPDGNGADVLPFTDAAVVNALMRMWRTDGQISKMVAFYETVKLPSPHEHAAPKGFFDSDRPGKATPHTFRYPAELPFTSRTYHELIAGAMDAGSRPLATHYLTEAVAQFQVAVRQLYSLTLDRKEALAPEDLPFNPLRVTPDMWKEIGGWNRKRVNLIKVRSEAVKLNRAIRKELTWYSMYAMAMAPSDPRWARLVTVQSSTSHPHQKASPSRTATLLSRGLMPINTTDALSKKGREGFLRAQERVQYLRKTDGWTAKWLASAKINTRLYYRNHRLRLYMRALKKTIKPRSSRTEESPDVDDPDKMSRLRQKVLESARRVAESHQERARTHFDPKQRPKEIRYSEGVIKRANKVVAMVDGQTKSRGGRGMKRLQTAEGQEAEAVEAVQVLQSHHG